MKSSGVSRTPNPILLVSLGEDSRVKTDTENDTMAKAELRDTQLQGKGCQRLLGNHQQPGRDKEGLSDRSQRENGPEDNLTLDFSPPQL